MNDYAFSGKGFYEFIDSVFCDKNISSIKFKGHGVSMTPFIKNGSTLTIKLLSHIDSLKIGDIVAVKQTDKKTIFVHRIIQTKKNQYLIKGDNKAQSDGWFSREAIIGVITEIKKESGKIVYYNAWYNRVIAYLSRTRILGTIILPWGRRLKQTIGIRIKT